MKYPNRIRELRQDARLSQRDLASRLGLSGSEIHKIETGARKLTQEHIGQFARFFSVSSDDIMGVNAKPAAGGTIKAQLATIAATVERIERGQIAILGELQAASAAAAVAHEDASKIEHAIEELTALPAIKRAAS